MFRGVFALLAFGLLGGTALADDWVAVKLRGSVFVVQDGAWVPIKRGDVVSDERYIRTAGNGRVDFQRDKEVITLSPNTQVRILDKSGQRFTTVKQDFGQVEIEAEVQNVQHFAVETPYLVAVVKGTHFTVTATDAGARVDVQRGHVSVTDSDDGDNVMVAKGQHADVAKGGELSVAGKGQLDVIKTKQGKPAQPAAVAQKPAGKGAQQQAGVTQTPAVVAVAQPGVQKPVQPGEGPKGPGKPDDGPKGNGKHGDGPNGPGKHDDGPMGPGGNSEGKPEKEDKPGKGDDHSGKGGKKDDDSGKGGKKDDGPGKGGSGKPDKEDKPGKGEDNSGKGGGKKDDDSGKGGHDKPEKEDKPGKDDSGKGGKGKGGKDD